jgi:SAM-dependent methyltransferase
MEGWVKGYFFKKFKNLSYVNKIDIGCGHWKEEGYFGLDIFNGPQVDCVIDFNRDKLPFADNSIIHAVSFHALEHIQNLSGVLNEIWRVLKPNAQFFVAVPYFNSSINMTNYFHVHNFNEHSFRFFSGEETTNCLPERIWKFHFTPTWGLKGSANSFIETEFRCLKIEFDYFPQYKHLTEDEKEEARSKFSNVVHNICFYLQAIKNTLPTITILEHEIIVPKKRHWMLVNNW